MHYNEVYVSHIHVTIHKLYKSKFSKTKLTDLHYIGDKNHSYSKLSQKPSYSKYKKKLYT